MASVQRMDLCLMIEGQEGVTWPQWVALAGACEEHGVPALFRSDHYLELGGEHPERGALDAWTTLAALGALTTRLRLGTLVSPVTFRHPSVLAKAVATADHVSEGRVELGLGAGWHALEHEAYGFAFPPPRERMDILEEQLQVILGSWSDGPFSFDGTHYRPARPRRPTQAGAAPAPADHRRRRRRARGAPRSRRAMPTSTTPCSRRPPRSASAVQWSSARARPPAVSRCRSRS